MLIPRFVVGMFFVGIMVLGAGAVSGQNFPNKPIRIVTSGVGGGNDFTSRLVAQGISGSLGQPVIVDNRGSGVIPGEIVSKAPPDGYTLLISGTPFMIGSLIQTTPYDPVTDFAPIAMVIREPNILVANASLPAKSVKELIALAKAKPGALNYAGSSTGSSPHLAAELFKTMAGVDIVRVPYKSGAQEMADLVGGHVQLRFGSAAQSIPHIKSGKLRALAVASPQPSTLFPELPTIAATLPGYESMGMTGMLAPAKTPAPVINRLNQELVRFLNTAEAKEQFFKSGAETVGSSPGELAVAMKAEIARWGKVIKDAGIKAE